ncbi:hypothetical protein HHI36_014779 [Cryptolaemus montrouzieri]|uniref:Peptidase metallopeptidase domain-containing protein n=1 Tax=Cryptolaemus montrouzieri TaxID=559131 RepID=A0ABD2N3M7_9CUCU
MDNETITIMKKPRCGVKDYPQLFTLYDAKWRKNKLGWKFVYGNQQDKSIAEKCFAEWARHTNMIFFMDEWKPDIVISYGSVKHQNFYRCKNSSACPFNLDGPGGVLGHAFFPGSSNNCIEIHLDNTENWFKEVGTFPPQNYHSLYYTLLHEIGHSLGIEHTGVNTAVMYPSLNDNRKSVELDQDDINAIQSLYGLPPVKKEMNETTTKKSVTRTTQSSETMQTTTVKRTATLNKPAPNLCEVNFKFHKLLILNKHFYVFFDDWVWVIPLKKQTIPTALQISSFIPLPTISFKNDGFMYQKPNGDIFFIYENNYYIVDPDSFALKGRYFLTYLGLPSNIKVNGGVNTYTGRSYIFFQ